MLDEQQPRRLPAGRDFIRKRHAIVHPRAVTATLDDQLPAALTLTIIRTEFPTSSTTSIKITSTSTSTSTSTTATTSSSSSVTTQSSSSSTNFPSASSPSVSVILTPTGMSETMVGQSSEGPSTALSGGAVAAIAIGILVLVASATVLVFRRLMQRRRQQKRTTARWLNGFSPGTGVSGAFTGSEKFGNGNPVMSPSYGDGYAFTGTIGAGAVESRPITTPPASYNNVPLTAGSSPRMAASIMNKAIVRCTFVPNLPDELAILNGEVLDVLQEFDDGWALCTNSKGDTGMVPLECLSSGSETSSDFGERSRRSSRRVSSMNGRI